MYRKNVLIFNIKEKRVKSLAFYSEECYNSKACNYYTGKTHAWEISRIGALTMWCVKVDTVRWFNKRRIFYVSSINEAIA